MKHQLQHIAYFIKVAELQSITQAAKILGVSKAAISQKIHLLESDYQFPLFRRTTRHIELTEEGKLLYEQAKIIQTQLDIMDDLALGLIDNPSGTLHISANPYFAEAHLIDMIKGYLSTFPNVSVELYLEERMPDFIKEKIDIIIGVNFPASDDTVRKIIGKTRYVLCASKDYLKQHGDLKSIKDLQKHHYIPHLGRKKENEVIDLKNGQIKLNLQSRLKLNDAHFMKQCALNGLGVIQVHDYVVKKELQTGELIELLPEAFNEEIPLYAYFQRHRWVQPKIRQFINLIKI